MKRRNNIAGDDYEDFLQTIYELAEQDELPALFTINEIKSISVKDLTDLMEDIRRDSCFEMEASLYLCPDCGKPHINLEVYMPENESSNYPLQ